MQWPAQFRVMRLSPARFCLEVQAFYCTSQIRRTFLASGSMSRVRSTRSVGGGTRDNRRNSVARVQKALRLENEVFVILIPRTVIGVGIQNQLGIGHVLNEIN